MYPPSLPKSPSFLSCTKICPDSIRSLDFDRVASSLLRSATCFCKSSSSECAETLDVNIIKVAARMICFMAISPVATKWISTVAKMWTFTDGFITSPISPRKANRYASRPLQLLCSCTILWRSMQTSSNFDQDRHCLPHIALFCYACLCIFLNKDADRMCFLISLSIFHRHWLTTSLSPPCIAVELRSSRLCPGLLPKLNR